MKRKIFTQAMVDAAGQLQGHLKAPDHYDDASEAANTLADELESVRMHIRLLAAGSLTHSMAWNIAEELSPRIQILRTLAKSGVPHTSQERIDADNLCTLILQGHESEEGEGEFTYEHAPDAMARARAEGKVVAPVR